MNIKPEDRRQPVKVELVIPAALHDRLIVFADRLVDEQNVPSSKEHVIRAILDETLPHLETASNGSGTGKKRGRRSATAKG